jgi:hypothetical protein
MTPKPKKKRFWVEKSKQRRRQSVTVCVAAIAERSVLVGVSDRMLTAGDVEFEPAQAKMWSFSSSVWALISGDYTVQAEILTTVDTQVKRRIAAQPEVWISVKEIAELYCQRYREVLRSRAEATILYPLGLDLPSFLTRQTELGPDLVASLAEKLMTYDFDSSLATIFIGNDHNGPDENFVYAHIYTTEGDKLSDYTMVGFAAIGMGKIHAESQFMFSGHWPSKPFHETLLLAYAAKKRAEVAPGVGRDTDMVVIGPGLGGALKVEDKHIIELERIYQKSNAASMKGINVASIETQKFVERVRKEYVKASKKGAAAQSTDTAPKRSTSHKSGDRQ